MAVEIVDLHIIKMVIFHNSYVCLPEGTCGIWGFSDGLCASSWKNILSTDQIFQQFLSDLTRFDEVWWSLMNSYVGKIPWTQMGVVCVCWTEGSAACNDSSDGSRFLAVHQAPEMTFQTGCQMAWMAHDCTRAVCLFCWNGAEQWNFQEPIPTC